MVAHPGLDVLILALTCTVTVRAVVHWSQRPTMGCPADTDRKWLPAALCAQYVPKLLAEVLSQHVQHDSGLAIAVSVPVPRRAGRHQLHSVSGAVVPKRSLTRLPAEYALLVDEEVAAAERHRTASIGVASYLAVIAAAVCAPKGTRCDWCPGTRRPGWPG